MKQDIASKLLEEYPEVFADIINVTLFGGEEVLKPNDLIQIPTESFTRDLDGSLRQGSRDVVMADVHNGRYCLICGEENQTERDNTMPERVMGYDFAIYEKQIRDYVKENEAAKNPAIPGRIHEEQLLAPVITVVIYWGREEWTRPLELYDMLRFPPEVAEKIKPYVANYPLNLIDMRRLPQEVRNKFKSDFRVVAEYMARKDDPEAVRQYTQNSTTQLRHPGAFLDLISSLTGKKEYRQIRETIEKKHKKGEPITMFCIEDEWTKRGMQKGMQKGIQKGIQRGMQQFACLNLVLLSEDRYDDLKRASTDEEYRDKLCSQYGITAEGV